MKDLHHSWNPHRYHHRSIPDVIEKDENRELYRLLALVDVIREGRPRERTVAFEVIAKKK